MSSYVDDREHVRIERPLLVQFDHDDYALKMLERALEEGLEKVKTHRAELIADVNLVVKTPNVWNEPYGSNAARSAFSHAASLQRDNILKFAARQKDKSLGGAVTLSTAADGEPRVAWDFERYLNEGVFSTIWNEAIELAAQITGGPAGTLIRDLKQGLATKEEANAIIKNNQEKKKNA